MITLSIQELEFLPDVIEPSIFYYIKSQNDPYPLIYFSNSVGNEFYRLIDKPTKRNIIATIIKDFETIIVVDTFAARDAILPTLIKNTAIMVLNTEQGNICKHKYHHASSCKYNGKHDDDCDEDAFESVAIFTYDSKSKKLKLIHEFQLLDVSLEWHMVKNKLINCINDIDSAISKRHNHHNIVQLNKIYENEDGITFDGMNVKVYLDVATW